MKENSNRGGKREGAGRKPIVDELKKNSLIQKAVNAYYKTDTDEEGKQKLIHELLGFERGIMFIAEHLLGKPKETIENINLNLTPIFGDNPLDSKNDSDV